MSPDIFIYRSVNGVIRSMGGICGHGHDISCANRVFNRNSTMSVKDNLSKVYISGVAIYRPFVCELLVMGKDLFVNIEAG